VDEEPLNDAREGPWCSIKADRCSKKRSAAPEERYSRKRIFQNYKAGYSTTVPKRKLSVYVNGKLERTARIAIGGGTPKPEISSALVVLEGL